MSSGIRTRVSIQSNTLRVMDHQEPKPFAARGLPQLSMSELRGLPQIPDWVAHELAQRRDTEDVENFTKEEAEAYEKAVAAARDAIKAKKLELLLDRRGVTIEEDDEDER